MVVGFVRPPLGRQTCTLEDSQLGRNMWCTFTIDRRRVNDNEADGTIKLKSQIYTVQEAAAI
jgi:hypothetical protein